MTVNEQIKALDADHAARRAKLEAIQTQAAAAAAELATLDAAKVEAQAKATAQAEALASLEKAVAKHADQLAGMGNLAARWRAEVERATAALVALAAQQEKHHSAISAKVSTITGLVAQHAGAFPDDKKALDFLADLINESLATAHLVPALDADWRRLLALKHNADVQVWRQNALTALSQAQRRTR